MDNPANRRRSARLRSQSVNNASSTIGTKAKKTPDHNASPHQSLTHSYVITPRGGVKRKAVERPFKNRNPKIIVRTSTPKPTSQQSDSVQEVFHDNLVRIQYVQHRDQQTGYTSREVNIDFADEATDGAPADKTRKRTQIVIKTVPVE